MTLSDPWLRTKSAEVLGRIGPPARSAIAALGEALSDDDRSVAGSAAGSAMDALKNIAAERR